MSANFDELEKEALALSSREKARLARALIDDLDPATDEGAEKFWIEEAQRRYDAYLAGELGIASGEEAMQRARQRLK
ncbi:MAG: addiction module protein [Gammaproteobacteria bacterium]|nr:addiction module protein [Gammaproteobacteria bacterium]